jgi:hypothetical protein
MATVLWLNRQEERVAPTGVNAGGHPRRPWNRQGPPPPGHVWWVEARTAARPWTEYDDPDVGPRHVVMRRACNGCGTHLGDVTDAELEGAVDGRLPDVRAECPVCTPPPGKAVEVWAPVQRFNDIPNPSIRYRPPRNTLDARYAECFRHRVACDCREAHMAEDRDELRHYARAEQLLVNRMRQVARLHAPTPSGQCAVCWDGAGTCGTRAMAVGILQELRCWYPGDEE